jgi:DNA-binding CsgD family transcriptional regulator
MRRLERLSVYRRLMGPHHGTATAMTYLSHRGRALAILVLGRTRGSFSDAELDGLRALGPTLSLCEASAVGNGGFGRAAAMAPRLTAREAEVLDYVRLGFTNAQIGRALGSTERTVRNQLSAVYEKLGAANRAEAVAIAIEIGLVTQRR